MTRLRAPLWCTLLQWIVLGALVGVVCGVGSAVFLRLLELATNYRLAHRAIVYALPIAGLLIGLIYERYGKSTAAGTSLVIDTIHDDGPEVPARMAPMVVVGTVLTHLFGGSAGREGTAVQMGASLTDWLSHRLRLSTDTRRYLLCAGVAGGFGSVFGTPFAGLVFGLEFMTLGRIEYGALVPALIAALIGDRVTRALGIEHAHYTAAPSLALDPLVLGKWLVFALAIALTVVIFISMTHWLKHHGAKRLRLPWRMAVGGVAVVALWRLLGDSSDSYLGLGVPTILRAFTDATLPPYAFLLKLVFTAITLGAGFLGGEVTPLFFIGAALGNTLGQWLGLPIALAAGCGMAAMFAAAANTPLALAIMAVELVGGAALPHVAIVCALAYLMSGARSIYARRQTPV